MTSRTYLGTLFEKQGEQFEIQWDDVFDDKKMVTLAGQQETCPTSGRKHWQIYVKFKNPVRITGAKKALGFGDIHLEAKTYGSDKWMADYCEKERTATPGTHFFYGSEVSQGARTDLKGIGDLIKGGAKPKEIAEMEPGMFIQYGQGIERLYRTLRSKKRDFKTEIFIYHGKPGTGKTRKAYEENPDAYFKSKNKWWDGYDGQDCVIIDDFDPYHQDWNFDYWLTLCDRYPMTVEQKGCSVQFNSKKIIITSNFHPNEWFMDRPNRDAFFRRIENIKDFGY